MTPEPRPAAGAEPIVSARPDPGDTYPTAPQRLRILLLEDSPADARLTQER
jgi:hypothetical protein